MAGDGWFGRHKWRPYNDAGQVLSSGVFMRICGKVAQYRRVRIHAHRCESVDRFMHVCNKVVQHRRVRIHAHRRENVCFDKRHCAINCAATTRAVISGITWKGYLHDKSRHLRMRSLHCPVAQTVAARFIAHFNYRTAPSRRLQIMHYRLVQRIQLLFQQQKPFADDLLIFSALAGALDLPAQIIDLPGINDLRRSAQPMQR